LLHLIWTHIPHYGTLQHSLYRFNLVTRVQWSRMQEYGCSLFKKYAS
ncbi:hypothetical protein Anapl_12693, partial [Anas platyrhynchos]